LHDHDGASVNGKPRKSATDTYVLDQDEVDQLDELSLTSVIGDFTDAGDAAGIGTDDPPEPEAPSPSTEGDTTINQLLEDSSLLDYQIPDDHGYDVTQSESEDEPSELIAPDLIFSESDKSDDDAS
jgi:hypothetical protein